MTEPITYREACRQAIRQALRDEPRAFVMGEDVGKYGGCYAVTKGLLEEFGPERIVDTPLAENGFVGAGIGAALNGMLWAAVAGGAASGTGGASTDSTLWMRLSMRWSMNLKSSMVRPSRSRSRPGSTRLA